MTIDELFELIDTTKHPSFYYILWDKIPLDNRRFMELPVLRNEAGAYESSSSLATVKRALRWQAHNKSLPAMLELQGWYRHGYTDVFDDEINKNQDQAQALNELVKRVSLAADKMLVRAENGNTEAWQELVKAFRYELYGLERDADKAFAL